MKRLTAICFLCLLLFNIAGYRLWFYYAEQRATTQLEAHLAVDAYDASELITLTVPLSLPYQTDWSHWEKVRGTVRIDGITYQYVQRKVVNGQMMLQCIPNKQQAKIESARDRFVALANSFQADGSHKQDASSKMVKITKPSLTDYDDHWLGWRIAPFSPQTNAFLFFTPCHFPQLTLPVQGQPPKHIA